MFFSVDVNLTNPDIKWVLAVAFISSYALGFAESLFILDVSREFIKFNVSVISTIALIYLGYVTAKSAQYEHKQSDIVLKTAGLYVSREIGVAGSNVTRNPEITLKMKNEGNGYFERMRGKLEVKIDIVTKDGGGSFGQREFPIGNFDYGRIYPGKEFYYSIELNEFEYDGCSLKELMNREDVRISFEKVKGKVLTETKEHELEETDLEGRSLLGTHEEFIGGLGGIEWDDVAEAGDSQPET